MTIINPNSIAGITSVTAEAGVMNFYKSDGTLAGLQLNGVNFNTTSGISTFNNVYVGGTITYEDVKNVDSVGIVTARDHINIVNDNKRLQIGAGQDLWLEHNGNNSKINNTTGTFYIQGDTISLAGNNGSHNLAVFTKTGSADLYFNNSKKFETTNDGIDVTGIVQCDEFKLLDGEHAKFGTGEDLRVYHNGTHSFVNNSTGNLNFQTSGNIWMENQGGTKVWIKALADAGVELYHNNSLKFATTSTGVDVTGIVQCDEFKLLDNEHAKFGTGEDLRIYHDGSHSWLKNTTGYLRFATDASGFTFSNADNSQAIAQFVRGGSVDLYHNNSLKFATTSTGISITGVPVATQSTGNVGLDLHATGSGRGSQTKYHNDHGEAYVGTAGDTTGNLLIHNSSNSHMLFATNNTERLRITSDGQVQIGGDSGVSGTWNLETYNGSGDGTAIIAGTTGSKIELRDTGSGESFVLAANGDCNVYSYLNNKNIKFHTTDGSGTKERLRIGTDGTLTKYFNSSTVQAAFGGSGQVNGIASIPSMAGTPFVVGRDSGSTRSAHFAGNLKFDSGYGIDFAANTAGGGTSTGTVFEDYEEGTYSTTMVSSNCTLDNSSGTGYYIKVGNMVHVRGTFSLNTSDGSPAVSGSDAITQALPYTRASNGTFTGTMLQQNINWGGPTSLAHPHYFNPVVADYVCQVASDGIRFYMNRIEYAYQRLNNSHLHVGYPGYTLILWNITYQTT